MAATTLCQQPGQGQQQAQLRHTHLYHAHQLDSSVKIRSSGGAPKRILIAPLDWGLGHTSRCVPLIRHLMSGGHQVTAAGNDSQLRFYREIFPGLELLPLRGYEVRYGRGDGSFAVRMAQQLPRVLLRIRRERRWLRGLLTARPFDGLISDNRYGLFTGQVPTLILTHQLRIRSGLGNLADSFLQQLHYRLLGRFGACWVPDVTDAATSLAGTLSHPRRLPPHAHYAGWLSAVSAPEGSSLAPAGLVVLLSGPEPQRSLLSDALWPQVQALNGPVTFIEGSAEAPARQASNPMIRHHRRLPPSAVQEALASAGTVVCRGGYSSLMDIGRCGCRLILVPTPGQTEQEYLAERLRAQGRAVVMKQSALALAQAVRESASNERFLLDPDGYTLFEPLLEDWLRRL